MKLSVHKLKYLWSVWIPKPKNITTFLQLEFKVSNYPHALN